MTEPLTPEALDAALADHPSLHDLARLSRRINAQNGWRPHHTTHEAFQEVPELLALIHSEITEAFNEPFAAQRNRELGDVIIRALDAGILLDSTWVVAEPTLDVPRGYLGGCLLELHARTSVLLEIYRKHEEGDFDRPFQHHLQRLIDDAHSLIHEYGGDTKVILADILRANLQRGYRHGGRRA